MATEDARKLFVAGLPESITEEVLRQIFEATGGKVVEVSLPRERTTGKVRGFGFVTFSTSEEANRARDELDGSLQAGRSISVRPFSSEPPKRGERGEMRSDAPMGSGGGASEDRTLYVGNLPYDTSQQDLTQFLTELGAGPAARIHLPSGPDGRMRGFGFVTWGTAEAAQAALGLLNNADMRGRRLMVNIAHPRGDRPPMAAGGERSRPPLRTDGPPYRSDSPTSFEGGAPREGGRAASPPEGDSWDSRPKKKKAKGGGATTGRERPGDERRRGGGSSWRSLADSDDED